MHQGQSQGSNKLIDKICIKGDLEGTINWLLGVSMDQGQFPAEIYKDFNCCSAHCKFLIKHAIVSEMWQEWWPGSREECWGWGQLWRWWWNIWRRAPQSEQWEVCHLVKYSSSRASPLLRVMCVVFQRGPTSTSVSDQGCPVGRTLVPQPGSGRC